MKRAFFVVCLNLIGYKKIRELCRQYLTFNPTLDIYPDNIVTNSLIHSQFPLSLWKDDNLSISLNEDRKACPLTTDSSFGHHQYKPSLICT